MYKVKILCGRLLILCLYTLIRLGALLPKKAHKQQDNIVMLTGTFYSTNWINAHIAPLVASRHVKHVYMVSYNTDYVLADLTVLKPPTWLTRLCGTTCSRLLCFTYYGVKYHVDYLGGFHILFNGSVAVLLAKLLRCRSIYFSVGGITETLAAGKTENKCFKFLDDKDDCLTKYICKIAANADVTITMGQGAKNFLQQNDVEAQKIHVISGAIDKQKFHPPTQPVDKIYDLVLTARLSKVKQVDLFLRILQHLKKEQVNCNALIIGDGPLLEVLKAYAQSLDLNDRVHFVGHQKDILDWLHQSKIYILTSRSEGLALSMLEGLKSGLPAIVPNVGDLSDVLIDGYNGALIEQHSIPDFAQRIRALLADPQLLTSYSRNAIESTKRFDISCVKMQWDTVFMTAEH